MSEGERVREIECVGRERVSERECGIESECGRERESECGSESGRVSGREGE